MLLCTSIRPGVLSIMLFKPFWNSFLKILTQKLEGIYDFKSQTGQVAYALRPAGAGCLLPTCEEGTNIHLFQWLGLVSWRKTTAIERMTSQAKHHKAYCHPSSE